MTWDSPVTFLLDLELLDLKVAEFQHRNPVENRISGLLGMSLSREVWQEMGRPSRIKVTPEVDR